MCFQSCILLYGNAGLKWQWFPTCPTDLEARLCPKLTDGVRGVMARHFCTGMKGKCQDWVKLMYPLLRLREVHVVQPDRLSYCTAFRLSIWGFRMFHPHRLSSWSTIIPFPFRDILQYCQMCPYHFVYCVVEHAESMWVWVTALCVSPIPSMNHVKRLSAGEDPETRRMRTVKNIADLRQNLEETMSSLRGTQISHR